MRTILENAQSARGGVDGSTAKKIDQIALDRFLEHLTDVGCLTLLQWAKRQAPDLLRTLMLSFLLGHPSGRALKEVRRGSSTDLDAVTARAASATVSVERATLRSAEREHISRVVSESRTLSEAAARLGIHTTTLWRKRKLYNLHL
jgi:hypothetical protein